MSGGKGVVDGIPDSGNNLGVVWRCIGGLSISVSEVDELGGHHCQGHVEIRGKVEESVILHSALVQLGTKVAQERSVLVGVVAGDECMRGAETGAVGSGEELAVSAEAQQVTATSIKE